MYFLYMDESGSNTSHFVLLGVAIHSATWRKKTIQISQIKKPFELNGVEIHTGWMKRRYLEQEKISDFESLDREKRREKVIEKRKATLLHISALGDAKKLRAAKKLFKKTNEYIHLTFKERETCLQQLSDLVGTWTDSRLFAEATNRNYFDRNMSIFENAFTNVISRFDSFLRKYGNFTGKEYQGLIVQDNNETVAHRLTDLMKKFHDDGTIWTPSTKIVETPFFVDSELTGMVQIADLCAYATRRFFENNENDLFDRIYGRFDSLPNGAVVGIRHYTGQIKCNCKVCSDHSF